jgi:hypothetical protein
MASKQLRGVGGVLSNLLSPPEAAASSGREENQNIDPGDAPGSTTKPLVTTEHKGATTTPGQGEKRKARLGRPPAGSKAGEPVEREKVSLRLRADLAAAYRDWSWEEHCQFSDLVDRALESYLKGRRKARMPERE